MKVIPLASVAIAAIFAVSVSTSSAISFKADNQDAATLNGNVLKGVNKTYGARVLKADEVKACVALAARSNALSKEVHAQDSAVHNFNKETAELKAEKASLESRAKTLLAEKATVDSSKPDSVAAYNAKAAALAQDNDAFNAKAKSVNEMMEKPKAAAGAGDLASYNDKVKQLNQQLDEFDDKCADKDYYADDYAAAKAALKP